jgi:thioredoxin reductase (NADPH)
VPAEATALDERDGYYVVRFDDGSEATARTVLITTGARYRKLDVPRLEELEGTCVYYAATMMEAHLCRGDPVAVVGGGNSAGQATLFLAQHTTKVTLLIRHEDLGRDMSRYLADRIERSPKVEVLRTTEVRELVGDRALEALVVEKNQTGERRRIEARELFVFIGAKPHTGWLGDKLALDDRGFVLTGRAARPAENGEGQDAGHEPYLLETSLPGVFAAGDVRSGSIKRVASAVGEGAMAIRLVHARLQDNRHPGHTSHGG